MWVPDLRIIMYGLCHPPYIPRPFENGIFHEMPYGTFPTLHRKAGEDE